MSELITPSEKTVEALKKQYCERDLDAEREARDRLRRETLADIGALFSAFPDLNSISICGYTPGWNDGDPCRHSQLDPYLNGYNLWGRDGDDEDWDEEEEDWGEEEKDEDSENSFLLEIENIREERDRNRENKNASTRLSDNDFEVITSVIAGMADVLEKIFDTNWKLVFQRTENGVEFKEDRYDCGH